MDPTRKICQIQDSFHSKKNKIETIPEFKLATSPNSSIFPNSPISPISPRTIRNKLFQDTKEFKQLIQIEKNEKLSKSIAYPEISHEYFQDRSSLILANIDLVFNFSDQDRGYLVLQYFDEIDYAVLDADSGFLKYLQFRLPKARAFTNCSANNKNFGKYNLNINCENGIVKYVKSIVPQGVNIVFSNSLNYKENLLNALKILKPEGTFISKINDNTDLELLFATTLCFDSFTIFKPFLEDLNNNVSYIIAKKYSGNSIDVINQLESDKSIKILTSFLE
jgi:hypothetical protein